MKNFCVGLLDWRFNARTLFAVILWFALVAVFTVFAFGQNLTGNVVRVLDGDTVDFRAVGGKVFRVRLIGVDAPESRQTNGTECRDLLKNTVYRRTVNAELFGRDVYSRYLGGFAVERRGIGETDIADLNLFMIQSGCAWESNAPLTRQTIYQAAETAARTSQTGLWAAENPLSPYLFRQRGNCPP